MCAPPQLRVCSLKGQVKQHQSVNNHTVCVWLTVMGGNELENFRDFRSLIGLVSQPSVGEHAILEMPNRISHWAVGKQSLATVNSRPRVYMYSTLSSDAPIPGVPSVTCPGRGKLLRGGECSLGVHCPCPHV